MMYEKLLCCGDREWTNKDFIGKILVNFHKANGPFILVNGYARGADKMSRDFAIEYLNLEVRDYPAAWETIGRGAGPIRNQKMLDCEHPDSVFAFHNDIRNARGTKDMVERSRKRGLPVFVFSEHSKPIIYTPPNTLEI